ncbi:MAG: IS701 family transposase [Elusimicrobiota bacterium]
MAKETELERYMSYLCEALGHADRHQSLGDYCRGLMLPIERKSVEPLAAHVEPYRVSAKHQSLHHFVAKSEWSDESMLERVRDWVVSRMHLKAGSFWIVDDTGFPKKGKHSVGVARQYCGQLGKQDNCQVAVSLSVASEEASLPVAYRLYLPEQWAGDQERRDKTGVPDGIEFKTKPEIALEQIRRAKESGLTPGVVLADAAYGTDTSFREEITRLELPYCVGVQPGVSVWAPGTQPLPAKPRQKMGRPPTLLRRGPGHEPVSVKTLAQGLNKKSWRTVCWREGSAGKKRSRFAAVRVRPAHRDNWRERLREQEWLLVEWPKGEVEPTKYWLSTLPANMSRKKLVKTAKMRWRIERDYQELKQELGLGHYEGRGWRGFHHHATLTIAAYGFLAAQRLSSGGVKKNIVRPKAPALPEDYTPRGCGTNAAPRSRLNCDLALSDRPQDRARTASLSRLRVEGIPFMTQ